MATNWWETGSTLVEEEPSPAAPPVAQEDNWWEAQSTPVREPDPVKDYEVSSRFVSTLTQAKDENYGRYDELSKIPERTPEVVAEMVKSFNAGKEAEIGLYREQEILGNLQTQIAEQEKQRKIEEAKKAREQAAAQAPKIEPPKPDKSTFGVLDTVSALGEAAADLYTGIPASYYRLKEGLVRPDKYSPEAKAAFAAERQRQEYVTAEQAKREAEGTSTTIGEAIRQAGPSLGFTAATMGVAIPAGVAAGAVAGAAFPPSELATIPVGAIASMIAAGAASAPAAYRMAGNQFLDDAFSEIEKKKGSPLTEEEAQKAYDTLLPIAQNTGLWEAGPEAVGNAVTLGVGKFVFGFGKDVATNIAAKALSKSGAKATTALAQDAAVKVLTQLGKPVTTEAVNTVAEAALKEAGKTTLRKAGEKTAAVLGDLGVELGGETITQVGQGFGQAQAAKYAETGSIEGAINEYEGLAGLQKAFSEVAPATLATMGIMGGVAGGVKVATKLTPSNQAKAERKLIDLVAISTKEAADNSQSITPATSGVVSAQADAQILQSDIADQVETADQRVARLKAEAQAAKEITLEEQPPVAGLPPAPEVAQTAQARITEREGQVATPVETPAGTRIEAAAYQAPDGTVYYGASHLDAMAKARDAGKIDQAAIDAKQEVASRETPEFGFSTDKDPFIGRSQAEVVATGSGQMLVDKPATGLLHSNEVSLDAFAQPAKPAQPIAVAEAVKPAEGVAPTITAPPTEQPVAQPRPTIDAATLNPRGKQANKILTNAGVDPETAAFVAQQYQDEAGDMGAEEWRAFVLDKFEENGGVIPAQMRYSEDQEYYQMAFGIGPDEAATLVENAKAQNAQMAQNELEQNKQWRRKDEKAIQAQQGVAVAQPEAQAVPIPAGEVPPSPTIEGRRVPLAAPEAAVTPTIPQLEPLRRVARAEQTEEDVAGLVASGFAEIYKGQPVITQAGLDALPEAERPRLTPEARKIQIDTGANEVAAEAISKNIRIGVDQIDPNVKMPAGWTLEGDVYVPPQPQAVTKPEVSAAPAPARLKPAIEADLRSQVVSGFEARSKQHKEFSEGLNKAVAANSLTEDGAILLREVFKDADPKLLGKATISINSRRRYLGMALRRGGTQLTENAIEKALDGRLGENMTPEVMAMVVTHEIGHHGYNSILTKKERALIGSIFTKMGQNGRTEFFSRGAVEKPFQVKYHAKNQHEFFAQSFAEYVFSDRLPDPEIKPIFDRIIQKLKQAFQTLMNRNANIEQLVPLYEKLLGAAPTPEVREARREPAITPQQDADYLAAVEGGDSGTDNLGVLLRASKAEDRPSVYQQWAERNPRAAATIQKAVDDAADLAGYNIGPMWHGTNSGEFTTFTRDGFPLFFFSPDKEYAQKYGSRVIKAYLKINKLGRTSQELTALESTTGGRVELWSKFRGPNAIDGLISSPAVGNREVVVSSPEQIKSGDPVTYDDQGNIIPLSQRFQPEEADIRYRRRVQMGRAGMEQSAVEARLQELGFPAGGIVKVVNQPDADFEGRTIIVDGKVTGIEINASAMADNATIDRVLNHEFAESANADGALNKLVERLTPKEKKEINDTITRLRYEERARTTEEAARAIETLAEAWKGRGFFTRAVARIEAWASKLGLKLTRRAAEYIAARNLADINSGFRTAYNQFINVMGEVREGRAEDQAVVDADMGRRSQTELTPQEIDQLEKGEKIRVYRAMQIIDGKLYPPMSALVGGKLRKPTEIGVWEKAEERPDLLDKKGKFVLQKGNKTTVPAAYNPYFHTSSSPLNDQFSSAYKRDNLVTVEVEIPASELTSDYKAEGAKDAVGEVRWNAGPVSSKLPADKRRRVFLSRYAKVVRVVPDSEVAEVISGLLEGTNLSIPENTVTPSLRSELEKRGVAVTPRPARGQEIRESRRQPEAIPTFTEGTPEAATLKEMQASMAKVDAASEAKGGKPETYKISDIASVWMDSGLGERELQDAIVEYTNLTPANAQKVARAIAKQYDIQQSIATAFLETQTGLSVEALPEGVTLPKEVDPDRPKPVMQRLFEVFMGIKVPPKKITGSEKAFLRSQILLKIAANRAAKNAQKATADAVIETIKSMGLYGEVRPKQVAALAKRAARVIWTSEKSVEVFNDYVSKVVSNANYDADLREAKDAQKRAKQLSKQKNVAMSPQRQVLDNISRVAVNRLDDPKMFADVVNYYMRGFKSTVSPDYVVVPDSELTSYLSQMESEATDNQTEIDRVANERLAAKYGVSVDQVNKLIESDNIIAELKKLEKREEVENLLTEKAIETQLGLNGYDTSSLRADQKPLVEALLRVDPSKLDAKEKQRFIRIANNVIYNDQTNGAQVFVAIANGQQNARQAAQDSAMVKKNRAWIDILPTLGSKSAEKTFRNWALELQSVADTFRNIFGKESMAKMFRLMGLYDLDRGFTDSNNVLDKIQEAMAEFYKKNVKKYGKAARDQDGILSEGIVGFLIQRVPSKGESESIAQRRDLIKQDIANRRDSQESDRIAMADRIEKILNEIDGNTIEEILNNLKQKYRPNYDSLMYLMNDLLPQYKDFLQRFDENFNDQANNYDNPYYLPIDFVNAGPTLEITPESEALFYDNVSLRPKQAANTIKRVDYTKLPLDKSDKPKEIQFNLRKGTYDSLSEQINAAYTSEAWQKIFSFMKTPEAQTALGGGANRDFMVERLNRLRISRMRRGSMNNGAMAKLADSLSTISRKLGVGIALGGVYQVFKQSPDQLISAIGTTGRPDILSESLTTIGKAKSILNKFSIGRRGDASAGYKYINQMEGAQNRLERAFTESRWSEVKESASKIADVWMIALKKTDFACAAAAWMTYYRADLDKKGIKFEGWDREAQLVDTDPSRQDAASYAENMTDIYQGSSDPTKMATFAQSGKSGWENLFKAIFVPFNSFAVQQRMRIYSDARDAFTQSGEAKKAGAAGLTATVGGMLMFHTVRRLFLPVLTGAGATALYALLGVDMDEPDEEKQKEEANKRWRQFQGEVIANMLVGGAPQFVEAQLIDAINYSNYLVSLQLESDDVIDDKGEIMSFDKYQKERSPLWRYRSFDNAMTLGMLDVGFGQAEKAVMQTKMLATPEQMEKYTPEEQRLLWFSALSEWMYLMRLNDADLARMITRARKDMIAAVEDREKRLKAIREGR